MQLTYLSMNTHLRIAMMAEFERNEQVIKYMTQEVHNELYLHL